MGTKFGYVNGESSRRRNERELRLGYFSHVFADYHRLAREQRDQLLADLPDGLRKLLKEVEDTGEVADVDQQQLDWGEIATLEDKILARQDDVAVARRMWQTRARYALLVGPDDYQKYLDSTPPDGSDVPALRTDLRRLLGATHFSYSLAFVRENNRRRIMWKVMWWTFVSCAVSMLTAWLLFRSVDSKVIAGLPEFAATLLLVIVFGCLGAYISVQRRLQETPDRGDPVIGILGLHQFNSIQPFPLIAGGVFAIVLYFILGAGFMQGDLFPALGNSGLPQSLEAWSKLFIWSLLAGFAERLVPDTLDRLTNQARVKGEAAPPAVPPAGGNRQQAANDKRADLPGTLESDADRLVVAAALKEAAAEAANEVEHDAADRASSGAPAEQRAARVPVVEQPAGQGPHAVAQEPGAEDTASGQADPGGESPDASHKPVQTMASGEPT